jgi:membrane-associated protease RseP (regulator of RpoE activity)
MESMEPADDLRRSVAMFFATLLCVYLVFGYQWLGGDPLTEASTAVESAKFAIALMLILLAHELGHYIVARRHGFSLSLPYFIPFPVAFGTLGAVIRLKTPPRSRSALLEMGAAGPIAGFAMSAIALLIGLPRTENHLKPWLVRMEDIPVPEPGLFEHIYEAVPWLFLPLDMLGWLMTKLGSFPEPAPDSQMLMIMEDPLLFKAMGLWIMGEPLSPYAELDPVAFAGWVGCLLTAINMLPIGQLDGGHVFNAVAPNWSRLCSRVGIAVLFLGALLWPGWLVWGAVLWGMGAWRSLPVPVDPPLDSRAKWVAIVAVVCMFLSFMIRPIKMQVVPDDEIQWHEPGENEGER